MNRRAWFVDGYGAFIVLVENDQVYISITGEDYEPFDRKLPEVDS